MVWVGGFGVLLFFIYTLEYVTQIPDNFFWLWEKVDESNTGGNYNEALNFDRKFCQQEGVLHTSKSFFLWHTHILFSYRLFQGRGPGERVHLHRPGKSVNFSSSGMVATAQQRLFSFSH